MQSIAIQCECNEYCIYAEMSNKNGCVYTNVVVVVVVRLRFRRCRLVLFFFQINGVLFVSFLFFSGFCVVQKSLHLAKRE